MTESEIVFDDKYGRRLGKVRTPKVRTPALISVKCQGVSVKVSVPRSPRKVSVPRSPQPVGPVHHYFDGVQTRALRFVVRSAPDKPDKPEKPKLPVTERLPAGARECTRCGKRVGRDFKTKWSLHTHFKKRPKECMDAWEARKEGGRDMPTL